MHLMHLLLFSFLCASSATQPPLVDPIALSHRVVFDHRVRAAPVVNGTQAAVVYSAVISEDGAQWLRLTFDEVDIVEGTNITITSLEDGAVQTLSRETIKQWGYQSAYFNGESVSVDMSARPSDGVQSLTIKSALAGDVDTEAAITAARYANASAGGLGSICGRSDDRVRSNDNRLGRLLSASGGGCTAWLTNDVAGCFLSCAHCSVSGDSVVEFNVPDSSPTGQIRHPAPIDQYAVDSASIQHDRNYRQGRDWAYFGTFPNSESGKGARDAYGGKSYTLAKLNDIPSTSGQTLRVTGYGVTEGTRGVNSQTQRTDTGSYTSISSSTHIVRYRVDTTGGNSGGPVSVEEGAGKGLAFAIHGYGGCTSSGTTSSNSGTSLANPELQHALGRPTGVCSTK